ncbi:MAG: bacillithiol biosynthesis cysteine-adding enzyme BshC [Flavobacteriales bacterium]|nr:bacillithiol biosynthesis cysteine-adding enzyme BshC [Flavobacteriales bacterium]
MKVDEISYQETSKFSNLVLDYLKKDEKLKPHVNHFPTLENFEKQIAEKKMHSIDRVVLVDVLNKQNARLSLSEESKLNIESLKENSTFTITTGHQLCLFTGPLYFLYKIISTINLVEQLEEKYPNNNFVPVFWMATEDHDFQEINHIHLFGKKIAWNSKQSGAVGRMNLDGFENLLTDLKSVLGISENADKLISLFEKSYLNHDNLADATRYLINELFGKYGLIILDGDDKRLKEQFISTIKKDVLRQGFDKFITKCSENLATKYKCQAYVRSINFFKLSDGKRELIKEKVTEKEIENNPVSFSPNVLLRPIYQETILPNIAYIGGGAELSYWMQLKTAFLKEKIPFPILILRNSVLIMDDKQNQKRQDLGFSVNDLFLEEYQLQKKFVLNQNDTVVSLQDEMDAVENIYASITAKATDVGLQNSIKSQQQKQLKSFKQLEKKLLRLAKHKNESSLNQISKIKQQLFPENSLQERYDNFIKFYLKGGDNFIEILKENLNPLNSNFVVLTPKIR